MRFSAILLGCLVVWASSSSPGIASATATARAEHEFSPEFSKYNADMKSRFIRNVDQELPINNPVTIKFFLDSSGLIYDAEVSQSSGDPQIDNICVDIVCCASPLPPPPLRRKNGPPIPLGGDYVPPSYFGSGVYFVTFQNRKIRDEQKTPAYLLIPKEILYRYPGVIGLDEINSLSNQLTPMPAQNVIRETRFQWSKFYKVHPKTSKAEIEETAQNIKKYYLEPSTAAHFE